MSRSIKRMWKGAVIDGELKPVRHTFTHRATLYHSTADGYRLRLENQEGTQQLYPETAREVEQIWQEFKQTGDIWLR